MQRTLGPLQWLGTWSHGALREFGLGHARQTLEVVVARVTKVGGAKAEVDGHGAAVSALVLQEVCAMLGAYLCALSNGEMDSTVP